MSTTKEETGLKTCPKCGKVLETTMHKHMAEHHPSNDTEKAWSKYRSGEKKWTGSSYYLSYGPYY